MEKNFFLHKNIYLLLVILATGFGVYCKNPKLKQTNSVFIWLDDGAFC